MNIIGSKQLPRRAAATARKIPGLHRRAVKARPIAWLRPLQ